MRYRYTLAFSIKGVSPSREGDQVLFNGSSGGIAALLTSKPDDHLLDEDRGTAIGGLILRALFASDATAEGINTRVAVAVDGVRQKRQETLGANSLLIIKVEGDAAYEPRVQRESDQFAISFDGLNKAVIRQWHEPQVNALLCAIAMGFDGVVGIEKASDAIVLFREDGMPVYDFILSGSAAMYVSRRMADEQATVIRDLFSLLSTDATLLRVQRLIRSSLETNDDKLRSFLAAWNATEILTNKVFSKYEDRIFGSRTDQTTANVRDKCLERIRDVMKDKYRLMDKFAVIASELSPLSADEDAASLAEAKKQRDRLLHGDDVDESSLPISSVRDLAVKYLKLHIQANKNI